MTDSMNLSVAQRKAARIAVMADLRDVRLFKASVEFDHFPESGRPLSWNLEMTPTTTFNDGAEYFVLEVEYTVEITESADEPADDEGQGEVGSISFKLAALYDIHAPAKKAQPTVEELDAYAKTYGTMAVYPYAREFIQSMTSRMGLPPLTLSTLRLPYPDTSEPPSEPKPPRKAAKAVRTSPRKSGEPARRTTPRGRDATVD
jgi:preprotein translocase subunit SecB